MRPLYITLHISGCSANPLVLFSRFRVLLLNKPATNQIMSKRIVYLTSLYILLFLSSCNTKRNLVYFSDLNTKGTDLSTTNFEEIENIILPGDVLNISIVTSSPESNNLFNNTIPGTAQGLSTYRVDKEGMISFPGIKIIKLGGLTLVMAKDSLTRRLSKLTKDPTTNISFANFKVTVIGEVARPGSFQVANNQINLLEAIGLAGDMTAYGRRDNVLVIRQIQGARTIVRLNINSTTALSSPYYSLKQNDIVYVEPDKSKEQSISQNNRYIPIVSASISVLAVVVSVLTRK